MEISTQYGDEVGWIIFDRPESRNAISKSMWDQIPVVLESLKTQGARVCVFRGAGGAFASGADLAELEQLDSKEKATDQWLSIRNALNAVARFELPVLAMIEGPCMGGGCLLAAACDLRYCSIGARFSVPVAQLGIKLDDDNIARILALVGKGRALELLMTGRIIDGARAEAIGLVNGVAENSVELESLVLGACTDIKKNAPSALQHIKETVHKLAPQCLDQDQEAMVASYLSPEFRARVARALDVHKKPRPPN